MTPREPTPDPLLAALTDDLFRDMPMPWYDDANPDWSEARDYLAARLRDAGVEMGLDVDRLARALLTAREEAIWRGWGSTTEVDAAAKIAREYAAAREPSGS